MKVWSKRRLAIFLVILPTTFLITLYRKINSPYKGTLSSYGYVLLVIYFLVHVKNPPVLPNLQQIPPLRPIPPVSSRPNIICNLIYNFEQEESHMGDRNIWFFDDIELLRQRWQSSNNDSVAELWVLIVIHTEYRLTVFLTV